MKVVVRCDSALHIGSGHVMRCLTLASVLRAEGAQVLFVCRDLPGAVPDLVRHRGIDLAMLPAPAGRPAAWGPGTVPAHAHWLGVPWQQDAQESIDVVSGWGEGDWLVVDHYALESGWEQAMSRVARHVMVIDDLADRAHACDVLLDQNLFSAMQARYQGLVPPGCTLLLGPHYALLRPEFAQAAASPGPRDTAGRRVFVFFGGTDSDNETGKALDAIARLRRPDLAVDVVLGPGNPHAEQLVRRWGGESWLRVHRNVDDMATLMARADFAIGASGASAWERCCVGLPTICIAIALNQVAIAQGLAEQGACTYLGVPAEVTQDDIAAAVRAWLDDDAARSRVAAAARALVDGRGCQRVAALLRENAA